MAVPVARVHLKVAHAALPALLPTPPCWNMLPLLAPPPPCVAAILPNNPPLAKPGRADADERWDARKSKPAIAQPLNSSASGLRSAGGVVRNTAGHGSPRNNTTSPPPPLPPPPKPGRADSVARWDAHKKAASPPSSSSSSGKWTISRSSSAAERWDVHKKPRQAQTDQQLDDDGERSSTGSNDIDDMEEEEEIVWKPRTMYAGPGFAVAAPESTMLPMPAAFLVPVA